MPQTFCARRDQGGPGAKKNTAAAKCGEWQTSAQKDAQKVFFLAPGPVHFLPKPAKSTVGCHQDGPAVDSFQPMKYLEQQPPTEEMRECCSILGQKMLHWPGVKMYHVFGTRAFYHRKVMFAMLPDKRSLDSCTAITFKSSADSKQNPASEWKTFELKNRTLVDDALVSLEKAYKDSIL